MTTPTASAIAVTNGSESFNIEMIHDQQPASRVDQICTALGRLLLTMRDHEPTMTWAIAAPHTEKWLETLERIPLRVLATFRLTLLLVDHDRVIEYPNPYEYDERALLDGEDLSDLVLGPNADDELDAFLDEML
ncbi:hypothetical protein [Gemmatimonas groenlandica]|uniref:Uncharacterized protein n=1 Tax=Gemmatimonas groenlandica TaxID=2732249 RepID=A0A6M4ING3_9BACT|nr:hypothetical protein [Gemmatimonas groenlandica]QJR36534.1 hypothetical protein HKW67_13975 [Gemmatimonas groenlandica]